MSKDKAKFEKLLEGVPLAPAGHAELMCRVCGGPKPPKQRCWDCYMQGRIYRQREIKDPEVQLILKNDRAEKRQKWRKEEKRVRKSVAGRVNTRRARTNRRMFQCQELDRLLSGITTCFERDNLGQWQLYADRLPEVASYLDEAEWVLPRLRKILKYLPNELESHK